MGCGCTRNYKTVRLNSKIEVEDRGWSDNITLFDVRDMKEDFSLEFDGWEKILEHLDYYIKSEKHSLYN